MMEAISESLTDYLEDEDFNIKTFDDKVFLTGDKGLFLKFKNGDEFEITIKKR